MDIFGKLRLRPSQLRTVSDRRFDDALCLLKTGENARANGAMYLGGFVVECLLKAELLETYPWLQAYRPPRTMSGAEQRLWDLCYRRHDLDAILERLPSVKARIENAERCGYPRILSSFKRVCGQWTVHARYSPYCANVEDARAFLIYVKEVRQWLT